MLNPLAPCIELVEDPHGGRTVGCFAIDESGKRLVELPVTQAKSINPADTIATVTLEMHGFRVKRTVEESRGR